MGHINDLFWGGAVAPAWDHGVLAASKVLNIKTQDSEVICQSSIYGIDGLIQ